MDDALAVENFDPPRICALCHRMLSSENDPIDLENMSICGDCKFLFLEENGSGDSDTDIDPMHAGPNQWSSDEEDGAWEEVENSENTLGFLLIARVQLQRSMVSDGQFSETEGSIRVRISEIRQVHVTNPFGNTDDDHEILPYVGNSGDYLDARSFEELLERLAEADNARRGAPPASLSFVKNLDCVVVNATDHNGLACAICKDTFTVGVVVNRLPCLHLYHRSCIKPWLSARNTCPLCRFELPTDDMDYENRKQINSHVSGVQEVEQQVEDTQQINSHVSGVQEVEQQFEDTPFEEPIINTDSGMDRGSEGGRWLFMAAPLVSLVGIGLALWLCTRGAIRSSGS